MTPSPRVQFRATQPLDTELRSRSRYPEEDTGALSDAAVESLEMYFALLGAEFVAAAAAALAPGVRNRGEHRGGQGDCAPSGPPTPHRRSHVPSNPSRARWWPT